MAKYEGTPELPNSELVSAIEVRLKDWDFKSHKDEENVGFALDFCTGIVDAFSRGVGSVYSSEFEGKELPEAIKPIYTYLWYPYDFKVKEHVLEVCLPSDMLVTLTKRADHHQEPLTAPDEFFEIMADNSLTASEQVEKIKATPGLVEQIDLGGLIVDDAVEITLNKGYGRNGIEFIIDKDVIKIYPYGEQGKIHQLYDFAVKHSSQQSLLAEATAGLAVLAAKYFAGPWPSPSSDLMYTDLDRDLRQ